MYQTTQDFIATSKAIKEAFLLSLLIKKPLRIKTARIGVVPMVPCTPYATFVNDRMVMQAYDPAQPVNSPNRTLQRKFAGESVSLVCNYDSIDDQLSAINSGRPVIYFEVTESGAPATAEAVNDAIGITVDTSLAPDAVVDLLNYICEGDDFSERSLSELHRGFYIMTRGGDFRVLMRLTDMVEATRPGTKAAEFCRNAGLDSVLGQGVPDSVKREMFLVCSASAAINKTGGITLPDIKRFFPMLASARLQRSDDQPLSNVDGTLRRIVEVFFS